MRQSLCKRIFMLALSMVTPVQMASAQNAVIETPAAGYEKGFFIQSQEKPFKIKFNGRVQTRYTLGAQSESFFSIPRARLGFSGYAFSKNLTYKAQMGFGKNTASLKDFYINYAFDPTLNVQVGQAKTGFSRHTLNSSGKLAFVDRAPSGKFFSAGRDTGILVHGKLSGFGYAVGLFNGTGTAAVTRFNPAFMIRADYEYGAINGFSEADLKNGPLRFGAGIAGFFNLDQDADGESRYRGVIDYSLKAHGFSSSGALYFARKKTAANTSLEKSLNEFGLHTQAGYVIGKYYQAAIRYSYLSTGGEPGKEHEILGGLSVYFYGHGLKWQTDAGAVISEAANATSRTGFQFRSQLQLSF